MRQTFSITKKIKKNMLLIKKMYVKGDDLLAVILDRKKFYYKLLLGSEIMELWYSQRTLRWSTTRFRIGDAIRKIGTKKHFFILHINEESYSINAMIVSEYDKTLSFSEAHVEWELV